MLCVDASAQVRAGGELVLLDVIGDGGGGSLSSGVVVACSEGSVEDLLNFRSQ